MLKVTVNGMRMRVTARYRVDGSVLNDTVQGRMLGAETTLEIDSPDPPERVAKVVRNAERGCFVMQALQNPVPVTGRTLLNGTPLTGAPERLPGVTRCRPFPARAFVSMLWFPSAMTSTSRSGTTGSAADAAQNSAGRRNGAAHARARPTAA
jgi:hypothetical protein